MKSTKILALILCFVALMSSCTPLGNTDKNPKELVARIEKAYREKDSALLFDCYLPENEALLKSFHLDGVNLFKNTYDDDKLNITLEDIEYLDGEKSKAIFKLKFEYPSEGESEIQKVRCEKYGGTWYLTYDENENGYADNNIIKTSNIEETKIFDKNDIKITLKSLFYDEWYGYQLKIEIENNSDINISAKLDLFSVNDMTVQTYITAKADAGKTTTTDCSIPDAALELCDITTIGIMKFKVKVDNLDTFKELYETNFIKIPTNDIHNYKETKHKDNLIFENSQVEIYYHGKYSSKVESGYKLYIRNKTKNPLTVLTEDEMVDGAKKRSNMSVLIAPKTATIAVMSYSNSELRHAIRKIECNIKGYENSDEDQFESGTVTITK